MNESKMTGKQDLLVEIGTEELPPQALKELSRSLADGFEKQLHDKGLGYRSVQRFATPRRLALIVKELEPSQPDQEIVRKGPALKAAYDKQGNPTKAALGFARSCGIDLDDLQPEQTQKGSWLVFRKSLSGEQTIRLIPAMLREALDGLPIPKRMRWGALESEFIRPVHWIVLLFGKDMISARILDVDSGRTTRGHRFHHPQPIQLSDAGQYPDILRNRGWVEPDFDMRRNRIRELAQQAAEQLGAKVMLQPALLDEVTALCEWPVAVVGSFDSGFLEVPSEALVETMQKNQKYFPLLDRDGNLLPSFIAISNIESLDPAQVRAGNERVIRPRFKDASFFWEQDLKKPLISHREALDEVVFEQQLGSMGDKSRRIGKIASYIASEIGLDIALVQRAAELCKCDLLTNMVGEFANLQGVMGRYYALAGGEESCVSAAIQEHYQPRHSGDSLPSTSCGQALAIADRLDTLVGIFAIGQRPTGVKDPYALRRASLGVLRILIETPLPLDLRSLLQQCVDALSDKVEATAASKEVLSYMLERLSGYYSDQKISTDVLDSVLALPSSIPHDIDRRVHAVDHFRKLPEAESLAGANKRIRNILKKSKEKIPDRVEPELLEENAEIELFESVKSLLNTVYPLFKERDYGQALTHLATLRPQVDRFFDEVMVMADNDTIRSNRLALVKSVSGLFDNIADISLLQVIIK